MSKILKNLSEKELKFLEASVQDALTDLKKVQAEGFSKTEVSKKIKSKITSLTEKAAEIKNKKLEIPLVLTLQLNIEDNFDVKSVYKANYTEIYYNIDAKVDLTGKTNLSKKQIAALKQAVKMLAEDACEEINEFFPQEIKDIDQINNQAWKLSNEIRSILDQYSIKSI